MLGPFWVPEAPWRDVGESIVEHDAGAPAWVHGRVVDIAGAPVAGAVVEVWQNGDDSLSGVQVADGPPGHLRGRFRTTADGAYQRPPLIFPGSRLDAAVGASAVDAPATPGGERFHQWGCSSS